MKFYTVIRRMFPKIPPVDSSVDIKRIISKRAEGSVKLQAGKYLTERDIESMKSSFEGYKFAK